MVGDAQQSIYGFRHADVELFEAAGRRLERIGGRASLQTNFRSRAEILGAQRRLRRMRWGKLPAAACPAVAGRAPATEPLVELLIVDKDAIASSFQPDDPDARAARGPWRVAEARALAARIRGS